MLSVYNIDLLKNTFNRTLKFGPNITRKCNLPLLCEYDDLLVRILLDFKGIKFKLQIQKVWLCQFTRSSSSILLQIFYFTRPNFYSFVNRKKGGHFEKKNLCVLRSEEPKIVKKAIRHLISLTQYLCQTTISQKHWFLLDFWIQYKILWELYNGYRIQYMYNTHVYGANAFNHVIGRIFRLHFPGFSE